MNFLQKNMRLCFGLMIVGATTFSCKKVLDVQPYTSFANTTAFTSTARVEAAMNGVYDAAQSGFYAGGAVRGYPFGAANIEQGDMRGEDMLNQALFYQVTYESTQNPTTANQEFMFNTLYALVNKANLMIEGVTDAGGKNIVSQEKMNQYIAESRFLRAMAHHELLIHFARPFSDGNGNKLGIIYRETGIDSDAEVQAAKEQKRSSVADNYAKILADLDFAEANLPVHAKDDKGADVKTFRASKAAAIALKTRVKLHMQDWAGVITEGNKLVPASAPYVSPIGAWALTATPSGAFNIASPSVENIFSIRNSSVDNAGVNGALPNMYSPASIGGRELVRVSPIIYNHPAWLCDDKRRDMLTTTGTGASLNYLTTKYKDPVTSSDAAPQIRYAEVLLNMAEAEARLNGVNARAVSLLNAVRDRALANPATQSYTTGSFASGTELIRAILNERRIEFLAEGKRWADIHRLAVDPVFGGGIPEKIGTGVATAAMYQCGTGAAGYASAAKVAAIPYSDYRFIWPIPLSERQQNPNYEQNPSY